MDLMRLYSNRFKVTLDESWNHATNEDRDDRKWEFYEVRGRHGKVYPFGWEKPAVYYSSNKVANRDRKKGWKRIQCGDEEQVFLIPMEDLEFAIYSIKPWFKRHYSAEVIEKMKKRIEKYKFKKKDTAHSPSPVA